MDQPPDLENVYSAVYTLYHSLDKSEKEKASSWLTDIQRSVRIFSTGLYLITDSQSNWCQTYFS